MHTEKTERKNKGDAKSIALSFFLHILLQSILTFEIFICRFICYILFSEIFYQK